MCTICTTAHARKSGIHLNFASSKNAFSGVILLFFDVFLTVIFYYQFRMCIYNFTCPFDFSYNYRGLWIYNLLLLFDLFVVAANFSRRLTFKIQLHTTYLGIQEGKNCKSSIRYILYYVPSIN